MVHEADPVQQASKLSVASPVCIPSVCEQSQCEVSQLVHQHQQKPGSLLLHGPRQCLEGSGQLFLHCSDLHRDNNARMWVMHGTVGSVIERDVPLP